MSKKSLSKKSSVLNSRAIAAKLLVPVISDTGNFDNNFDRSMSGNQPTVSQDIAFIKQLCFGCLRWLPRLSLILNQLLSKPIKAKDNDIKALLLLGIYQLYYLQTADYAAISSTVDACKQFQKQWAKGLVNAVLRNAIRQRDTIAEALEHNIEYQTAHPKWLLEHWQRCWQQHSNVSEADNYQQMIAANNQQPPMTLRCVNRQQTQQQFDDAGIAYRLSDSCDSALTLESAQLVNLIPGFEQGLLSVQDESAQWAAQLLQCQPQQTLLDACAAPGGKTIHCLQLQPSINIVALDNSQQRLQRLEGNLARININTENSHSNVTIVCRDILDYHPTQLFDRILLDAPCSGTGVIRRHPDIKTLRRPSDIEQFTATQWAMLEHCWSLLKSGGVMLYCTCSVMPEENSLLIEQFMHQFSDCGELAIDSRCGIAQNFGRQILPRPNAGDGFFYALLTKK